MYDSILYNMPEAVDPKEHIVATYLVEKEQLDGFWSTQSSCVVSVSELVSTATVRGREEKSSGIEVRDDSLAEATNL